MGRSGMAVMAVAMVAGTCQMAEATTPSSPSDGTRQAWSVGRKFARDDEGVENAKARMERAESAIATARKLGYDLVPVALQAMEIHELCRVQQRVDANGDTREMNTAQWFGDHQDRDDEASTDAYACCFPVPAIGLARIVTPFLDGMPAISGREFPRFVDRAAVLEHAGNLATKVVEEAKGKAVEKAEAVKADVTRDAVAQSKGAWDAIVLRCQQALTSNGYPSSLSR